MAPPTGFDAPTQFPDRPVTTGIDLGPGAGSDALGLSAPKMDPADRERLLSYLPALLAQANRPESTSAFRNYVRALRAQVM